MDLETPTRRAVGREESDSLAPGVSLGYDCYDWGDDCGDCVSSREILIECAVQVS